MKEEKETIIEDTTSQETTPQEKDYEDEIIEQIAPNIEEIINSPKDDSDPGEEGLPEDFDKKEDKKEDKKRASKSRSKKNNLNNND